MISEYGEQIKAFFHFAFKHFFEFEFGIRVSVEILIFVIVIYILSKIIGKIRIVTDFIYRELVMPLRVRLLEKLAFETSNPNWQERANKIKDTFKKNSNKNIKNNNKKSHAKRWILIYVSFVVWIVGFHYLGEEKRNSYEVFFLGEKAILEFEEWTTNTLLSIDEHNTECFFHNKIEVD